MKLLFVFPLLFALTACACPRTELYKGVPYELERTAGYGMVDEGCAARLFE